MQLKPSCGRLLAWIAGFLLLFGPVLSPDIGQAGVVIIVNASVTTESVSKNDLKKYFLGKQVVWNDGQSIKPALLNKGAVHEEFVSSYIGKTTSQLTTYWRRMIFTGQGIQPRSFNNTQDLIEYVAETPGAVGYISSSDNSQKIKTLSVSETE